MPTLKEVARRAGVSPGVASRAINGDRTLRVRDETRRRVLETATELGYTPNSAARALRTSRSGALGIAVHDAGNPIYRDLISGAQAAVSAAGMSLLLVDMASIASDDAAFRRVVQSGAVEGLLFQRAEEPETALLDRLVAHAIPIVLLNDAVAGGRWGSVAVDDMAASRLATEHLLDLGHERIGILQVDGPANRRDRRFLGWSAAMEARALVPDPRLVVTGGHTIEAGAVGMAEMLRLNEPPTAVFVANAMAAVGALSEAKRLGVQVPHQLSLIALHDLFFAAALSPPLTVVRLPLSRLGSRAVEVLLDQVDDAGPVHEIVMEPTPALVERGTTAPSRALSERGRILS